MFSLLNVQFSSGLKRVILALFPSCRDGFSRLKIVLPKVSFAIHIIIFLTPHPCTLYRPNPFSEAGGHRRYSRRPSVKQIELFPTRTSLLPFRPLLQSPLSINFQLCMITPNYRDYREIKGLHDAP